MARHCQEIAISRVGHFVRMEVIRTKKHQTKYYLLQPYKNPKSFGDYLRAWQQILMFFVRIADSKTQVRPSEAWKRPKYRFIKNQRTAWRRLTETAEKIVQKPAKKIPDSDQDSTDRSVQSESDEIIASEDEPLLNAIEKACLAFCISLLDHRITRHEYGSPLVCALAVLGVKKEGWIGMDQYPPMLSATIKISRMMVVQQTWEQHIATRNHQTRSTDDSAGDDSASNSSVESHPNAASPRILNKVKVMTDRFMIRGSHSPIQ